MISLLQLTPYTTDADFVAPSPNHEPRRASAIEGIVLHATADDGNEAATLTWLRSPKSRVSCHLMVSRNGQVIRLVGDQQRAWHAGLAWWRGTSDVNSITLGIEIANRNDGEPYADAQYRRVAEIVAHYCRQGISLDDVVSHEAIASDRRTDPLGWDWERFRAMVQDELRPTDDGPRWNKYDRRSGPRPAVDGTAYGYTDLESPSIVATQAGIPAITTSPQRVSPITTPKPRPVVVRGKPFLCSRTIWLNGLAMLAAGSVIIGEALDLATSVGLIIPKDITMWALFGVGLVNILLRVQTTCPIGSCLVVAPSKPNATVPVKARSPGQERGRPAIGPR